MKSATEIARVKAECVLITRQVKHDLFAASANPSREEAFVLVDRYAETFYGLALLARLLANSYRNFDVGVALIGLRPILQPGSNPWFVSFSANTKEAGSEKYCGEQRNLDRALRKGVRHCIAFFIAGEPQPDHGSGKKDDTLTACERCRWRMRGLMYESAPIILPDTLHYGVHCHRPKEIRQRRTIAELHEFHGEALDMGKIMT